jgi:hypothetical protein
MLQLRFDPDLAEEPVCSQSDGELGAHHLYGDIPLMAEIPGEVHVSHPAAPELAAKQVPVA